MKTKKAYTIVGSDGKLKFNGEMVIYPDKESVISMNGLISEDEIILPITIIWSDKSGKKKKEKYNGE